MNSLIKFQNCFLIMMSLKYICINSVIFVGKQDKIFRKQKKYLVFDMEAIIHFFLYTNSYLKIVSLFTVTI